MYKVRLTSRARLDMKDIVSCISTNLQNPQAADGFVAAAEKLFDSLRKTPNKYSRVQDSYFYEMEIYWCFIKNYLVFYRVYEDKQQVSILRVLHQKRNWQQILTGNE